VTDVKRKMLEYSILRKLGVLLAHFVSNSFARKEIIGAAFGLYPPISYAVPAPAGAGFENVTRLAISAEWASLRWQCRLS